jgi:SSS family solute:Na+ symporter
MLFSIILISVFLVGMVGIGIWGMKKTTTLGDFFLGGRTIGPWVSAFAYGTTYFSAVLFIGFAGKLGWGYGWNVLWIAAGNTFIGTLAAWLVLGRRTRRMTHNLDALTMPEFFFERFQAKGLKILSALIIFVFLIPYSASVFKGLGHMFQINFNISYDVALLIMTVITGVYLILGGYFAVTLTDFIQGLIMIVGALALVAVMTMKGGGPEQVLATMAQNYPSHIPPDKQPSLLMLGALVFMTSFGVWGMPQMVQKFYAIKDEKMIPRAAIVTTVFSLIIAGAAYFNGALTHLFFNAPIMGAKGPAFDQMIPEMLKANLPPYLMGVILLLVLSASMSTLSSLVLVSSSSVAIDLYKGHVNPGVSKENSLVMMRFLSAVFVGFSFFIAKYELAIIVTLMSLSWGAIAGSFMAPFLYGLYWKRTTAAGTYAGMIAGLLVSVGLFYYWGAAKAPLAASVGMIVPFLVVPLVSWVTPPPSRETVDKAFAGI